MQHAQIDHLQYPELGFATNDQGFAVLYVTLMFRSAPAIL